MIKDIGDLRDLTQLLKRIPQIKLVVNNSIIIRELMLQLIIHSNFSRIYIKPKHTIFTNK